jgi:hypothetical protein
VGADGRPDLRYLATSFSDSNVTRDSDKVRKLVESEKYQALWGDKVRPSSKWGTYKFENTAGGNRDCRPFASLTGGRGDRVLIDDPHSVKAAESDVVREDTVTTFREGATDRLNDVSRSATIVIMQRLHSRTSPARSSPWDGFVHLNLPMEFECARTARRQGHRRPCRTVLRPANDGNPAILFEDPRTKRRRAALPRALPGRRGGQAEAPEGRLRLGRPVPAAPGAA